MTENSVIEKRLQIAAKMGPALKGADFYKRFEGSAEANADGMFSLLPAHEDEDAALNFRRIVKTSDRRIVLFTVIEDNLYYAEFEPVDFSPEVHRESIILNGISVRSWFGLMFDCPPDEPMIFTDDDEKFFLRETRQ